MTERELLAELRKLYDEYERLNRAIQLATHRQHFSQDPEEVQRAFEEEAGWLNEITRLMDRMRAAEGHLLRARGKLTPSFSGAGAPGGTVDQIQGDTRRTVVRRRR